MNDYERHVQMRDYLSGLAVLVREYLEARQQSRTGEAVTKKVAAECIRFQRQAAKALEKVIAKVEELVGPECMEALQALGKELHEPAGQEIDL